MWHGSAGAWGFWWIVPVLFWILLLFAIGRFLFWGCGWGRRRHWGRAGWGDGLGDAEAILQRRLASGEIDEAEYRRLHDILFKK